jgi:hypothetical protein
VSKSALGKRVKLPRLVIASLLILSSGCAVGQRSAVAGDDHETVLLTYHVKPGDEPQFQALLARTWADYMKAGLVFAQPHLIARDTEDGGMPRFVEIFTWISHSAPVQASALGPIKDDWATMQSLCEARGHASPLEGGEVQLISAAP